MYRLITCTSLLVLALSSGCSDADHYLSEGAAGAPGTGTGKAPGQPGKWSVVNPVVVASETVWNNPLTTVSCKLSYVSCQIR